MSKLFNTLKKYVFENAEGLCAAVITMNGGDFYLNV